MKARLAAIVVSALIAVVGLTGGVGWCGWRSWAEASLPVATATTVLTEDAKLLPGDGAAEDYFGGSVAVSGDVAVIGAAEDDDNGPDSGSAYVFVRNGEVWTEEAKLLPSDGAAEDYFGGSVAVSGDVAVIGAVGDDDNGPDSGSAYVFVRNGEVWTEEAKLLPSDGAGEDFFGYSVAVSGDVAVIGAPYDDNSPDSGSAHVFVRNGEVWTEEAKLLPSDGAAVDLFGWSVAVSGEVAVIGAAEDDDNGVESGSAYVFVRNGEVWTEEAKLLPSDGAAEDYFGGSVAVSGDVAVIGAYGDDDNGPVSGSAYVFVRNGEVWTEQAKLLPSDGAAVDLFGLSVAVSGDVAVIGALYDDDNGPSSGSAYVFVRNGGAWTEEAKLLPSDGADVDFFGLSVAVSGDVAVSGAVFDDDNGPDSGSAYVFLPTLAFADGFESGDTSAWSNTVP